MSETTETFVYRLTFSREGAAIWLGHLDMMRTFERSIRRAGISVLWSQGYNPRPQMVFALPISVGLAAKGDFLDIYCVEKFEEQALLNLLNSNLPEGLIVNKASLIVPDKQSLMSLVCAARYKIEAEDICKVAQAVLKGDKPLETEKTRKGKTSIIDIRPLLIDWSCHGDSQLEIMVKAGSSQNLRPDILLQLLVEQGGLPELEAADAMITRQELILSE